jgi:hypothetical protein
MHADDLFKTPSSDAWQELAYPLEAELEWLSAQGVAPEVMAEPWPLRSAGVVFDDLYGFDFKRDGEPAIIFKAEDRGDELDLIAWEVSTGRLASWHGNTFCLGDLDQIGSPATYFMDGALRIHASPLEWLMAQREGIVILRQEFAYAHLRFSPRIICDDLAQAEKIECWLRAPEPTVEILIAYKAERQVA